MTKKCVKKQKPPKPQTTKFIGDDDLKLSYELLHHLPFSVRKQRTLEPKKFIKKFGNITMTVDCEKGLINTYDIKVLFSIFKFFQDNSDKIKENIISGSSGKDKIINTITDINFSKFVKNYTTTTAKHRKDAELAIKRLNKYTIYLELEKEKTIIPLKYLYDFELKDDIISFSVIKKVYENLLKGLTCKFDTLLKIKGNIATALYLFLIGQNKTSFSETSLFEILGLKNNKNKHSRAELKAAFIELEKIGFLKFIEIRKDKDDNYYCFSYPIINKPIDN
jgi:hypothetical protein